MGEIMKGLICKSSDSQQKLVGLMVGYYYQVCHHEPYNQEILHSNTN